MVEKKEYLPDRGYTKPDWDAVESPELSDEQLAQAKPFSEAFPDLSASIKRGRGRPPVDRPKAHVSLRLSPEVIERFKATGPGWQTRMNALLDRDVAQLRSTHLARIRLLRRGLELIADGQRFYRVLPGHREVDITEEIVARDKDEIAELEDIILTLERDGALS